MRREIFYRTKGIRILAAAMALDGKLHRLKFCTKLKAALDIILQ